MAKSSPAFQWYPADFMAATASWTCEEVGIYTRLLNHQWVNGYVPTEPERIARIVGCELVSLEKAWEVVGEKFKHTGAGKLKNQRLESVRRSLARHRKAQTERIKKRWEMEKRRQKVRYLQGDKNA